MLRVAVGVRLGANTCEPHQRLCGTTVDVRGLHGLGAGKLLKSSNTFTYEWRGAIKRAQIPVVKEPVCLSTDGKRPDSAILIAWSHGKPLAWDVIVPDTFAKSHLQNSCNPCMCSSGYSSRQQSEEVCTLSGHYSCLSQYQWKPVDHHHGTRKRWNSFKIVESEYPK